MKLNVVQNSRAQDPGDDNLPASFLCTCTAVFKTETSMNFTKEQIWLQKLLGVELVPQYEVSRKTESILQSVARINQTQDEDAGLAIEDLVQKTKEYSSEAKRLEIILAQVGLSTSTLSQSGMVSVKTLANTAFLLGLKDCSTSSLLLGLTEFSQSLSSSWKISAEEENHYSTLLVQSQAALVKADTIQRASLALEEQKLLQVPLIEQRNHETGFLKSKKKEYQIIKAELEEYQKQLRSDLYHEKLVQEADELNCTKDKTKSIKAELDSYYSLPPDIPLAKVKVEEAKRELAKLEQELSANIEMLHM